MVDAIDIELRLVDAAKNKFRLYGITSCRTLFGELALRIVWGRIGHRRLRERTEIFPTTEALERRHAELLQRRRQHGYVVHTSRARETQIRAVERDIVEAHGLPLASPHVRALVSRWHNVTRELARFVGEQTKQPLDLVDISTLAVMYAHAEGFA